MVKEEEEKLNNQRQFRMTWVKNFKFLKQMKVQMINLIKL